MKKLSIFLLFITCTLFAQEGEWISYLPEYNYIPDRNVTKMLIDHEGNKWVGTFNGLAKYDGESWTQYTSENSELPDSITSTVPWVYSFSVDGNNNLWVATEKLGIVFFDGNTWTRYDTTNSPINGNWVLEVISDKEGGVWISSLDSRIVNYQWVHRYGLDHFDGSNWNTFELDTLSINENAIRSMTVDFDNNLWIGSIAQIIKYDGINWFYYEPDIDFRHLISVIKSDKDGNIWFGPEGDGLLMFDGINFTHFNELELPRGTSLRSMDIDHNNNIWMVGGGIGLAKYDGNIWQLFDSENSGLLAPNNSTIIVDSTGLVWIGTFVGISTFDGVNWDVIGASGGLLDNIVNAIAIDKNNTKWIGTSHYGLVRYDGMQWSNYAAYNSDIPNSQIYQLEIDETDNLWLGTWDKGLVKYDGEDWIVYNENNSGLPANWIKDITIDKNNEIWICAFQKDGGRNGYLINFDGHDWKVFNWENSILPREMLQVVAVDDSNNVWVGTLGYGLYKYNGTTWTNFNTENSDLSSNDVQSIIIDKNENKWIGTSYGICKYNGSSWICYTTQNSDIAGNDIVSITEDTLGNIWAGLYWGYGLSKFDGSNWNNYNTILDTISGGISPRTIAIDKYGNKWMGDTWQGVLVFNEDKIVVIENKTVNNIPKTFELYQNYPNPFNPITTIKYEIPADLRYEIQDVRVIVYNLLGQVVEILVNQKQNTGSYEVTFPATSGASSLPSGVYFYKLQTNNFVEVKKMLLIR